MKAIITNESKDNNPSPLEELGNELLYSDEHRTVYVKHLKSFGEIKQALTNYANMVGKYDKALRYLCDNMDCPIELIKDDSFCEDNCGWKPNHSPCWDRYFEQDITKVLEGKINE
jgi:hypothetical protein